MRCSDHKGTATLANVYTISECQRVVKIPEDQPEEGINGYKGKDFEKRKFLRRGGECHKKHQ